MLNDAADRVKQRRPVISDTRECAIIRCLSGEGCLNGLPRFRDPRSRRRFVLPRLHRSRDGRRFAMNAQDAPLVASRRTLFEPVVPALLALADGTVFRGRSIGAEGSAVGEVVFNTSMTGYQEILTDPSYQGQIVTLTYPHIGNVGVNLEDAESRRVHAAGLVIRDLPRVTSNFRTTATLSDYLRESNVVGIADIDTRKLTRILRDRGAQNGCIVAGSTVAESDAVARARSAPSMAGLDLAKVVSCDKRYEWTMSTWALGAGFREQVNPRYHVVAYDYGVKHNILRMLAERGCRVTVVPAKTPSSEVLAMKPSGVFLSNGPGDPEPCGYAIEAIREIVETGTPTFGICLGHQLL